MTRISAIVMGAALVVVSGCASSQAHRGNEPYALLLPNHESGLDPLPDNTRLIDTEPPRKETSFEAIEGRLAQARRLYRDLAFRASLEELMRAQKELEARLGSDGVYELLDRLFLLRALDQLALGNADQARDALRQAAILRSERTSLDAAEFSPDVRAEYDAVCETLETEAALALATETEPPGAKLTLDGREVGATPVQVRLHRGRHYLVFQAPSRMAQQRVVEVDGKPPPRLHVELTPLSPAQVAGELAELDAAEFAALDSISRVVLVPAADGATPVHIGSQGTGWGAALLDPSNGDIRLTATVGASNLNLAVPELVYSLRDAPQSKPLVRKWWFWTVIGVAVVATSVGLYFGIRDQPEPQLIIARQNP
ncbi:MAG: PEGA domain-containing protein [Myxococcales bacterium]|nr:PEGA domain-containing protein [Myxococcales bacterium]MDH3485039.1 PEGA domain-containing protein [Myxococcales bacterium]